MLILHNLALILQPILHFLLCSENRCKHRIVPKCCCFQFGTFFIYCKSVWNGVDLISYQNTTVIRCIIFPKQKWILKPIPIYNEFISKKKKLSRQPENRWPKGLKLKNHYVHSSCTPSRAALLTGRYASNTGLPCAMFPGSVAGQNSLRLGWSNIFFLSEIYWPVV